MTPHIDFDQLALYTDGALDRAGARNVSEHLKVCARCRAEQTELSTLIADLSALPDSHAPASDRWSRISAAMTADADTILANLREAVAGRQIAMATSLIDGQLEILRGLQATDPNAPALLNWFAQWMELGFTDRDCGGTAALMLLRRCFARFPKHPWIGMLGGDIVHLRVVEGIIALHSEQYDDAISHFGAVVGFEVDVADPDLLVFSYRSLGRAYTRQGKYLQAMRYVDQALSLARSIDRAESAAACAVLKAWLLFQMGKNDDAVALLNRADTVLRDTDDYLSLANIGSAFGRFERRLGRYGASARRYVESIEQFRNCPHRRNHLARALVNFGLVNRLLAARAESERREGEFAGGSTAATSALRQEAEAALNEAEEIYGASRDGRGRGMVLLVRAYLEMDAQRWPRAAFAAAEAYELGRRCHDTVLKIRARVQQCRIVFCRRQLEEGDPLDATLDAESLDVWIREAMQLVAATELLHLRANTLTWHGIISLHYGARGEDAEADCAEARQILETLNAGDYARDELLLLGSMLSRPKSGPRRLPLPFMNRPNQNASV